MRLLLQDNYRLGQAALLGIMDAIDSGQDSFTADELLNLMAVDVLKQRQEQMVVDKMQRSHEHLVDFIENIVPEDIELDEAKKVIEKQLKKAVWPEKVDTEANPDVAVTGNAVVEDDGGFSDWENGLLKQVVPYPPRIRTKKGKK